MHHEGHADTDEVEHEHRGCKNAHGKDVRRGRNNGRNNEDDQNGVTQIFPEKAGIHDAEERQKHHKNRQLKGDAQPKNDREKEIGIFIDLDERIEILVEREQEIERTGEDPAIAEIGSSQKEAHRSDHEGGHEPLLGLVQPGRNKKPYLVENKRRCNNAAHHEADLQVEIKAVNRVVVVQLRRQMVFGQSERDRPLHEAVNLLVKSVSNKKAHDKINHRMHNAPPELFGVLQQTHAR